MNTYPLVSIICIAYGKIEITRDFIISILKTTYKNTEIIVVDNNPKSFMNRELKEEFPNIIFFRSTINSGYAGGCNYGIKLSKGDYLLFMNNDITVEPDFIEPLLEIARKENVGAVSPKILYFHEPTKIQYAGFTQLNRFTLRNKAIGYKCDNQGDYDKTYKTNSIHGATMLIGRDVIRKTGLFWEGYFLYFEEFDYSKRLHELDYETYFVHDSIIYHKESMSISEFSFLKSEFIMRNRLIFSKRFYSGFNFLIIICYLLIIATPIQFVRLILQNRTNHIKYCLKGIKKSFVFLRDPRTKENEQYSSGYK
jgi:GT2 family glycosyltransferase